MEMRFNITSNEDGNINEYQIKQIVCAAINSMLWYFIEIAIVANLIFFIIVMGCMYFWKPSRFRKEKTTFEMEDTISDEYYISSLVNQQIEAPPAYDELILPQNYNDVKENSEKKSCPGFVQINVEC